MAAQDYDSMYLGMDFFLSSEEIRCWSNVHNCWQIAQCSRPPWGAFK